MKIVINRCYGGFELSKEAQAMLPVGKSPYYYRWEEARNDPELIAIVEALGDRANGTCAKLKIVEIPDDVLWEISDYDGLEEVRERHRSWC